MFPSTMMFFVDIKADFKVYTWILDLGTIVLELIELVKNREAIDSRSGMPLYHMSFIIQTLVREENMVKGGNENACETYIGSRAENMKICLQHSRREYLGAECCEKGYLSLCEYRSVQISADTLAVPSPEKARDMDVVMIETEPIRPGYVRLQTMSPQLHKGHTFWIDETTALLKKHTKRQQTGNRDIIIHQGIKCLEWPESACEWISRPRPSGWPGQRFIESVLESGCMAISRSHPFSYKREVEWQLLFPCAETILATEALTDAQRYCMNVFKILVDFHLRDFSIRLKTTTFKTIVYYACEILPMDAWEQNISGCLMYLLDKLYVHLNKKWLPNYFIPTNNMYDHLTEYEPLAHSIYGLRSYLAMGIYFLADHHGVRQMSAFDAALEDIKEYRNHRNVRRSYHDVLLPNLLQLASAYIWNEWYPFAGRVLHSAFQEVLAVAEENEEVPAFEDFVKKVLATEDTVDRRYMFRYMDRYYGTSLGKNVESTEEMARFKDIEGIGDLQQFHNETIPRNCLGDTVLELTYIIPVVERLRKEHKFSDAVCLLQIVIKKGKHFRDGFMVPDVVDDPVLKQDLIKQSELPRTLVNTCLLISYQRLFNCLSEIGEVDTFTEHLQDYEDICYDLDSNETLRNVAHIWEIFGNNKKAQELRQKATQSRTEKAERLARAIMLILSGAAGKSLSSTLQQFI